MRLGKAVKQQQRRALATTAQEDPRLLGRNSVSPELVEHQTAEPTLEVMARRPAKASPSRVQREPFDALLIEAPTV